MLLYIVAACENRDAPPNFTSDAVKLGEQFLKEVYTVDDPDFDFDNIELINDVQNRFSTYFTKKEFANLAATRFFLLPKQVANKQNNTISVQSIALDKYDGNQEESNSLDFDHSFTLIFTDRAGNEIDKVKMKGQMTVIDTKNGLKIDRYYDGNIIKDKLHDQAD
ncbi:hypothetical protein ACFSMW_08100 [Virgibacillus halophilus]